MLKVQIEVQVDRRGGARCVQQQEAAALDHRDLGTEEEDIFKA